MSTRRHAEGTLEGSKPTYEAWLLTFVFQVWNGVAGEAAPPLPDNLPVCLYSRSVPGGINDSNSKMLAKSSANSNQSHILCLCSVVDQQLTGIGAPVACG